MNEQLELILQQVSLHTLLMVTSGMLSRSGFGDVRVLDRRTPKQKSRYGGHELMCYGSLGILPMKIIVKVLADGIRLRHLDEMAGAVDRTRADLGLVISPHRLSGGALKHRESYKKSRIEVIDGPVLADLLIRNGVGVGGGQVDEAFFEALEEASPRILACIKEIGQ